MYSPATPVTSASSSSSPPTAPAARSPATPRRCTAEHVATRFGHQDDRRLALHVDPPLVDAAPPRRVPHASEPALAPLRAGADIHAARRASGRRSFLLAPSLAAGGGAAEGTPAFLVLEAAKPWSRQTHKLFPPHARARAVELMLVGELLSREDRFAAYGPQAVVDAWTALVMPCPRRSRRAGRELQRESAGLRAALSGAAPSYRWRIERLAELEEAEAAGEETGAYTVAMGLAAMASTVDGREPGAVKCPAGRASGRRGWQGRTRGGSVGVRGCP